MPMPSVCAGKLICNVFPFMSAGGSRWLIRHAMFPCVSSWVLVWSWSLVSFGLVRSLLVLVFVIKGHTPDLFYFTLALPCICTPVFCLKSLCVHLVLVALILCLIYLLLTTPTVTLTFLSLLILYFCFCWLTSQPVFAFLTSRWSCIVASSEFNSTEPWRRGSGARDRYAWQWWRSFWKGKIQTLPWLHQAQCAGLVPQLFQILLLHTDFCPMRFPSVYQQTNCVRWRGVQDKVCKGITSEKSPICISVWGNGSSIGRCSIQCVFSPVIQGLNTQSCF